MQNVLEHRKENSNCTRNGPKQTNANIEPPQNQNIETSAHWLISRERYTYKYKNLTNQPLVWQDLQV